MANEKLASEEMLTLAGDLANTGKMLLDQLASIQAWAEALYVRLQREEQQLAQVKDFAYKRGKRAMAAEKLLHDFLELVEIGIVSLEPDELAALWKTYHDFLESPERVYKGDWERYDGE